MYDIIELNNKLVGELKDIAKSLNIPKYELLKKQELIYKILDQQAINPTPSDTKPKNNKPDEQKIMRPRKVRLENIDTEPKTKAQESTSFFNDDTFGVLLRKKNCKRIAFVE